MKITPFVGLLALVVGINGNAQSDSESSEEVVALSPFVVSAEADTATSIVTPQTAYQQAPVPVTLVKRADAVVVQFVLSNDDDKQEVRNADLYKSFAALGAQMRDVPGLRVEQREVRFSGGNRKFSSWGRDSAKSSFVNVVVFGDLTKDVRTTERLKQIRDLIQKAKLEGKTKAADGAVGLYLKDPGQYRREIVDKIFEDIEYLKKHLGPDFEVQPTGLNRQVLLRVCGESDVEVWIDYSFGIESIKEMGRPRK
jgi:hypothetical protein